MEKNENIIYSDSLIQTNLQKVSKLLYALFFTSKKLDILFFPTYIPVTIVILFWKFLPAFYKFLFIYL